MIVFFFSLSTEKDHGDEPKQISSSDVTESKLLFYFYY